MHEIHGGQINGIFAFYQKEMLYISHYFTAENFNILIHSEYFSIVVKGFVIYKEK